MMRFRLIWFLSVLLLSACSREPQLSRLSLEDRILAFGDSLTYGTGADTEESYPARLETMTGRQVINGGVAGEGTAEGRARLAEWMDGYRPALVILCHGGNDLLRRLDIRQMEENIEAMIQMAQERGIQVVLIGVPRPGLFLSELKLYRKIGRRFSVPVENSILKRIISQPALRSDQMHPNARGYEVMAEAVAGLLRKSGAIE